ncbi:hypothetical protein KEM54_004445 [Ascosphaera aggregata]|nr:hypothetical protein KEM54_004445 [Ascosphaera aggregata]
MPLGNPFSKKGKQQHEKQEPPRSSQDGPFDPHELDVPNINSLTNTDDTWLNGQEGHLTQEQAKAFEEFKAVIEKEGLYTPAVAGKPASADDAKLLRFLRARRFDVEGGFKQFQDTCNWRRDNCIDELYATIDVDSYEESRRMYPQWTGRRDRRGIPVYVFDVRYLNNKNMAAYSEKTEKDPVGTGTGCSRSSVPKRLLRLFALYENMTEFVGPLCSSLPRPHPEAPIVATANIVDISGVGLKQFWNLKGHMQDASVLATAHYPETLDRIYIIGAPAFFPTVWGWIKRWFDPVTTSKIFILSASDVKPTLEKFMPLSSFPKQYGGELDWQWGDMPNLDEPARQIAGALERLDPRTAEGDATVPRANATVKPTPSTKPSFIVGPVKWLGDRLEILGSVAGIVRHRVVTIAEQIQSAAVAASATSSVFKSVAAVPPAAPVPVTTSTITTTTEPAQDGDEVTKMHVDAKSGAQRGGAQVDAHGCIEISKKE